MPTRCAATCSTESDLSAADRATRSKAGLILTGGGARAAYQIGVLKAVRELLPMPEENPFSILCGTSAGAINAALLAAACLAGTDNALAGRLAQWRAQRTREVLEHPDPEQA